MSRDVFHPLTASYPSAHTSRMQQTWLAWDVMLGRESRDPSTTPVLHSWDTALFSAPESPAPEPIRLGGETALPWMPRAHVIRDPINDSIAPNYIFQEWAVLGLPPVRQKGTGKNMSIPRLSGIFPTFRFPFSLSPCSPVSPRDVHSFSRPSS